MKPLRIQFDFSPEAVKKLDEMVKSSGAASRAEVVRRSLSLFEHVLLSDAQVVLKKNDGTEIKILVG